MQYNNDIEEVVFSNFEDLRNQMIKKYDTFLAIKEEYEGIFHCDITKQFIDTLQSFITHYITVRCSSSLLDIKVYVEDRFTFDNIERIISEDGAI